jgi:hypothetical protein
MSVFDLCSIRGLILRKIEEERGANSRSKELHKSGVTQEQTMGRVTTEATIENLADLYKANLDDCRASRFAGCGAR